MGAMCPAQDIKIEAVQVDLETIQPVNVERGYHLIDGLETIFLALRRFCPDSKDIFSMQTSEGAQCDFIGSTLREA
jgi:hypothetical protein